jgi:hypothetical protein
MLLESLTALIEFGAAAKSSFLGGVVKLTARRVTN